MVGMETWGEAEGQDPNARLIRAFVDLADTLVEGFAVVDFLYMLCERCVDVLDVDEVGVLLTTPDGTLQLSAASSEEMDILELFEMQQREGPCYDAFATGDPVVVDDLTTVDVAERWPGFVPRALEVGFRSAYGFPMRLRDDVIGALNVFRRDLRAFEMTTARVGQAIADIATVGIMQERVITHAELRTEQLQRALDSRVIIEQAKGVLAERIGTDPVEAFRRLREHARSNRRPIREVCVEVIEGDLAL